MALEKVVAVDKIEVNEQGDMSVRTVTRIVEDGVVISESFHRRVVEVGDDVNQEASMVKAIAGAVHTPERIALKQQRRAERRARRGE
jgi:hypothetical protein